MNLGLKRYEIANHLGNVLATISDKAVGIDSITTNEAVEYYEPSVSSATDYFPFGMLMPGRNFKSEKYRFGFNGQERDDEIAGKGNFNTALYWEYDTRLGRRWNVDPKPNPSLSNYVTFADNPIWFNDPLGDIFKIGAKDSKAKEDVTELTKPKNQKYLKFQEDGEVKVDFGELKQKKIDKILRKDQGLSLINNMSTAKDENCVDLNFFYGTESRTINAIDRGDGKTIIPISFPSRFNEKGFFLNLSKTDLNPGAGYLLPEKGYQGQVFIANGVMYSSQPSKKTDASGNRLPNYMKVVPRVHLVLHELRENFFRTMEGQSYDGAHNNAGGSKILEEVDDFKY